MKKLVVINSTLGCGKSTIAKSLGKILENSTVIHGDDISSDIVNFSVYN